MLSGREEERARIERLLEQAAGGKSGALLLRGESGIGKSALLDFALRRAEGFEVLSARGIEGEFELPQLAQLSAEDQVFVTAFVRSHGSIKEMERIFGVSYPTIKARLNRITQSLDFVETDPGPAKTDVIERLRRGEITASEAIAALREQR